MQHAVSKTSAAIYKLIEPYCRTITWSSKTFSNRLNGVIFQVFADFEGRSENDIKKNDNDDDATTDSEPDEVGDANAGDDGEDGDDDDDDASDDDAS